MGPEQGPGHGHDPAPPVGQLPHQGVELAVQLEDVEEGLKPDGQARPSGSDQVMEGGRPVAPLVTED